MQNKRISPVSVAAAQNELKDIYSAIEQKMHKVPNIFQNLGQSPVVLKAFLAFSDAANHTHLTPQLREQIALAVGEANSCSYCLSAHTAIGRSAGLEESSILEARRGHAAHSKDTEILKFAKLFVSYKGNVADEDVARIKEAGVTDQELVEIFLVIMINMFTNYFNHLAQTEIDFPNAPKLS